MRSCVQPPSLTLQFSRAGTTSSFTLYPPLHLLSRIFASQSSSLNIDGVIFQGCQAQHSSLSETAFRFTKHLMSPRAAHTSSFASGIKTDQCPLYALNPLKHTSQIYIHTVCMKAIAPLASSHPLHPNSAQLSRLGCPPMTSAKPSQSTQSGPGISPSESLNF